MRQRIPYEPPYKYFKGIRLEVMIFDAVHEYATVYGRVYDPEAKAHRRYGFIADFHLVATLFTMAGNRSDALLESLHGLLMDELPDDEPLVFPLEGPETGTFCVPQAVLKAYKAQVPQPDRYGNHPEEEACFILEAIIPMPEYVVEQRRKRMKNNIEKTLQQLGRAYKKYLKLRFSGLAEACSRRQAGLEEDTLFTLGRQQYHLSDLRTK